MSGDAESLRREVERLGRIERRMEQLLSVTGELAAATTSEDIARIAIDKGIQAVGASYGGLWTIDAEARVIRILGAAKLPRGDAQAWAVMPLERDAPLTQAARTGEPVFVASLADYQARYPSSFERIREISPPDVAFAILPIAADGPPIAVLSLTFDPASQLDPGELTFLTILARQCGLALARVRMTDELARAYAVERDAHLAAEEATRAREEILSVVSHDLRNPLGTILMGASALISSVEPDDPKGQRIRTIAERINRQSERMTRLIEDLVDFSSIQAGQLAISPASHSPEAILASATELLAPFVRERGLQFETHSTPQLPALVCDAERAVQVFSNLVTNALKVTPRGGKIGVGARRDGDTVVFYVHDTGPGLDPEELPLLFERHWRSKKPTYRGAALGLSIARGIVDSHRGRIWAESRLGAGSTFFFTLTPPSP